MRGGPRAAVAGWIPGRLDLPQRLDLTPHFSGEPGEPRPPDQASRAGEDAPCYHAGVVRSLLPTFAFLVACGSVQVPGPSPEAVRAYTEAGLLSRTGRHAEAAEAYDLAASLDPESVEVWLAAARAREQLGQWGLMRERAERAHEVAPRDPRPLLLLGRAHLSLKELSRARLVFSRLTEVAPERGGSWRELGAVAELQGDLEGALRAYQEATRRAPGEVEGWLRLGALHRRANRPAAAAEALSQAIRRDQSRRELDPQILSLAIEGGDRVLAREAAGRLSGAGIEAGFMAVAGLLLQQGDLLGAANELEDLLNYDPLHAEGRLLLGHVLARVQRYDEAEGHLKQVPIAGPHGPDALRALGKVALARGETARAVELLDQARLRRPERPGFVVDHASALRAAGRPEEALTLLTQGIERWPRDSDLRFVRAMTMHSLGDEQGALWAMNEILDVDADHPGALNYIGFTWADAGERLEEAEAMIRRALKRSPEDPAIVDSLGWVLYKRGEHGEARRVLERAAALDPRSADIRFHLAHVLRTLGEQAAAEAALADALERAGGDREDLERRWHEER